MMRSDHAGPMAMLIGHGRTMTMRSRRHAFVMMTARGAKHAGCPKRCLERHRKEQQEQNAAAEHTHRVSVSEIADSRPDRCHNKGVPSVCVSACGLNLSMCAM